MDNATYGALKRIIEEVKEKRKAECLNKYCVVNQVIGGNDIQLIESWIDKNKPVDEFERIAKNLEDLAKNDPKHYQVTRV